MDFKESLKMAQSKRGVSNKALAKKLGVSTQQMSNWRCYSSPSVKNLLKICKALDFSLSEFAKLSENKTYEPI